MRKRPHAVFHRCCEPDALVVVALRGASVGLVWSSEANNVNDAKQQGASILVTGATGIFGSRVVAEALARGYRPIVLTRDETPREARSRLRAVLAVSGSDYDLYETTIIAGDVSRPGLGMSSRAADFVRSRVSAVIHCAACTSFRPRDDARVWSTNVKGVENLIRYLGGANIPLYHVSTAYVAGGREDTVYEYELNGRYGFTNTYECSKWQAERKVRSAFSTGALSGAIFRPGILVGSGMDGSIADFQNVYRFLRLIDIASSHGANGPDTIRIEARPWTPSNLVPVDWAARALWQIIETDGPCRRTYHLTNPQGNILEELRSWANGKLAQSGMQLKFVDELDGRLSSLEGLVVKALRHYLDYTKRQPSFDASNTLRVTRGVLPFPTIDASFYDRLWDYARQRQWKGASGEYSERPQQPATTTGAPILAERELV